MIARENVKKEMEYRMGYGSVVGMRQEVSRGCGCHQADKGRLDSKFFIAFSAAVRNGSLVSSGYREVDLLYLRVLCDFYFELVSDCGCFVHGGGTREESFCES